MPPHGDSSPAASRWLLALLLQLALDARGLAAGAAVPRARLRSATAGALVPRSPPAALAPTARRLAPNTRPPGRPPPLALLAARASLRGRAGRRGVALGARRLGKCPKSTGGHCYIWNCQDTSKEVCESGHCFCKDGFCAVGDQCVPQPEDDSNLVVNLTSAPLVSARGKYLAAVNGTLRLDNCTFADAQKVVLPVGGLGMLRLDANHSECLAVVGGTLKVRPCAVEDMRQQFVLPPGAYGPVKAKHQPAATSCVVSDADMAGVHMGPCVAASMDCVWGLGDEAPPSFFDCPQGAGACAEQEEQSVKEFCASNAALCARTCPGGCENEGTCDAGYCRCKPDFTGPTCAEPAAISSPLDEDASAT